MLLIIYELFIFKLLKFTAFFLFAGLFFSCSVQSYKKPIIWKTIDYSSFEMQVPTYFKIKPHQGVDFDWGEIKGGKIEIIFGFGTGVREDVLTDEEYFKRHYYKHLAPELFNLPGTLEFEKFIENVYVLKIYPNLDSLFDSTVYIIQPNYFADLKYENKIIKFPFIKWIEQEGIEDSYDFYFDDCNGWKRKIYLPKNKKGKKSGVVLVGNFGKHQTYWNKSTLEISIYGAKDKDKQLVLNILNSVYIRKK